MSYRIYSKINSLRWAVCIKKLTMVPFSVVVDGLLLQGKTPGRPMLLPRPWLRRLARLAGAAGKLLGLFNGPNLDLSVHKPGEKNCRWSRNESTIANTIPGLPRWRTPGRMCRVGFGIHVTASHQPQLREVKTDGLMQLLILSHAFMDEDSEVRLSKGSGCKRVAAGMVSSHGTPSSRINEGDGKSSPRFHRGHKAKAPPPSVAGDNDIVFGAATARAPGPTES